MNKQTEKILNEITLIQRNDYLELNRGNRQILIDRDDNPSKFKLLKDLSYIYYRPDFIEDFYLKQLLKQIFTDYEMKRINEAREN